METVNILKYGMIVAGILIVLASFWSHSIKKMSVNFAVVWELLGGILIVIGVIPVLSSWIQQISAGTGIALFGLGTICFVGGFQLSVLVSQLTMKNQELAMQVSLLNQESERILSELEELRREMSGEASDGEDR